MSQPSPAGVPRPGQEIDWSAWRGGFPLLKRKVYLNSCAYAAMAQSVSAALGAYLAAREESGCAWDLWVERYETLRLSLASLLGAGLTEIAITSSVSAALNAIASGLRFDSPRNRIVITDLEFPTHGQIWHAQAARGAEIVQIPSSRGRVDPERFAEVVDERTLLVATSEVCYRNGARLPIAQIADIAHRNGALLLVDSYQAIGTARESARDHGADIIVGGMMKYLLGTSGIAFACVAASLIEQISPTATGWFAQQDIGAMDATAHHPSLTARRFEAGTPPVANVYMAEEGLRIIREIGLGAIEERISGLTGRIKRRALEAGYTLATPQRHGAMIALASPDSPALVAALAQEGILASTRDGNLRISTHFYNDESDIDALFDALRKHERLMPRMG
jgi:selenocysteine lyase/cysteine desulfurase